MFLKTIAEAEAAGPIAEIYAQEKAKFGFVMAATACWTARPDCFMSRFYDATGAAPEAAFLDNNETVRSALTVGKALA